MVAKFKLIVAGIVAVLLAIAGAFLKGRSSGKASVQEQVRKKEVEDVKSVAETRVKDVKAANEIQKNVIGSSDKSVDDELLNNWTRSDSDK